MDVKSEYANYLLSMDTVPGIGLNPKKQMDKRW